MFASLLQVAVEIKKNTQNYYKLLALPYFFSYKTEFFPSKNNSKNLDPSYKMDLDLWDCLGRVKLVLQKNFIGLILSYL